MPDSFVNRLRSRVPEHTPATGDLLRFSETASSGSSLPELEEAQIRDQPSPPPGHFLDSLFTEQQQKPNAPKKQIDDSILDALFDGANDRQNSQNPESEPASRLGSEATASQYEHHDTQATAIDSDGEGDNSRVGVDVQPSSESLSYDEHDDSSIPPLAACSAPVYRAECQRIANLQRPKIASFQRVRGAVAQYIQLGMINESISILHQTPPDRPEAAMDLMKSCVLAAMVSREYLQQVVVMVSSRLVESGEVGEAVQLLCAIDCVAQACQVLIDHEQWREAANLAKLRLSGNAFVTVTLKWADHLIGRQQIDDAIDVLLSVGAFGKACQLLLLRGMSDRAACLLAHVSSYLGIDIPVYLDEPVRIAYAAGLFNSAHVKAACAALIGRGEACELSLLRRLRSPLHLHYQAQRKIAQTPTVQPLPPPPTPDASTPNKTGAGSRKPKRPTQILPGTGAIGARWNTFKSNLRKN
eukprot:c15956_g2_i1.p1 GENE.c15956_g2_i1~~c15956_g2_i1.p1  ORF type:complete len:471 (-),score=117.64 c15956_g2_i1:39-1451(-)